LEILGAVRDRAVTCADAMPHWTPEKVRETLDGRDSASLRQLADELTISVTAGRAVLLANKPWLRACSRDKEDDVQDGLMALFAKGAAILTKFGAHPSFRPGEGALRRYVIGVTFFVLQRKYQKHRTNWEELREDLAIADDKQETCNSFARLVRVIDLEQAVSKSSPVDQALFRLIYVEQREPTSICAELEISEGAYYARKSRLLQRLRTRLDTSEEEH